MSCNEIQAMFTTPRGGHRACATPHSPVELPSNLTSKTYDPGPETKPANIAPENMVHLDVNPKIGVFPFKSSHLFIGFGTIINHPFLETPKWGPNLFFQTSIVFQPSMNNSGVNSNSRAETSGRPGT